MDVWFNFSFFPLSVARADLVRLGYSEDHILTYPADVSKEDSINTAAAATFKRFGAIHAVVNSAGISLPKEFETTTAEQFENVLRINVVGSRNAVAACLPYIRRSTGDGANGNGRVVLVSSMAGQTGIFGYTAYSASKFALTGFAQALQMELVRYGIQITLVFPPDTDTPMLAEENKIKPPETAAISAGSGVFSADAVAASLVDSMAAGKFTSTVGLDGWMSNVLTGGMNPEGLTDTVVASLLAGPLRLIAYGYLCSFYGIVAKHWRAKNTSRATAGSTGGDGKRA